MHRYARLVNHWCPRSPEGEGGGGTAPPPAAAAPAVTPPAPTPEVVAQPSKQEWVDSQRTLRELAAGLKTVVESLKPKEAPKSEPTKADGNADVTAQLADMRLELDLERAMRAAKIPEGSKLGDLITTAAKAMRPPNVREFVAGYADMVPAAPMTVATVPVVPPIAKSDTGAAVSTTHDKGTPDGHPFRWPPEVIAKMSPVELRDAARDYETKMSGSADVLDVFEQRRKRAAASIPKK